VNVFLDSSALAKRYIDEAGSDRVQEILVSADSLGVSVLCVPEIASALCRRRREGHLTRQQYFAAVQALMDDIEDASVIGITAAVVARAVDLLERWALRSSDSLQIACAAEWSPDLFVSADMQQCIAAEAYGLELERVPVE